MGRELHLSDCMEAPSKRRPNGRLIGRWEKCDELRFAKCVVKHLQVDQRLHMFNDKELIARWRYLFPEINAEDGQISGRKDKGLDKKTGEKLVDVAVRQSVFYAPALGFLRNNKPITNNELNWLCSGIRKFEKWCRVP